MAKLAFLGSPDTAVPSLDALVEAGHEVVAVMSQPDRRRGRGSETTPVPVKRRALDLGLAMAGSWDDLVASKPELAVVVAFGRIVPEDVLDLVPMVNLHFSLLPRWRGAAPVERAILAGDTETGVCVMRLEAGLDTGPVLARTVVRIAGGRGGGVGEHSGELLGRLARIGAHLLVDTLAVGPGALRPGEAQSGEVTYAAKLTPDEFRIDWRASAEVIARLIRLDRAFTSVTGRRLQLLDATFAGSEDAGELPAGRPWMDGTEVVRSPGSLRLSGDGRLLVSTADRDLCLTVVQPEGKRPMDGAAWWRGCRPAPEVLGT